MWNQLQAKSDNPAPLVSQRELKALLDEPREAKTKALVPAAMVSDGLVSNPRWNQILCALSESNFDLVKPGLEMVSLTAGQIIHESDAAVSHVYFPTTCTASLLSSTAEGDTVELALTGRNGLIGVPLVLGGASMGHSVQIHSSGQAYRMSAERFARLLRECDQLQQLALNYVQSLMTQMAQSIVCSRHHSVTERLSQWMLWHSDGLGSNEIHVTHETIAHMLGVRRESITQAAGKLQSAGLIRNSRGKVVIQNREGLLQSVCECYGRIQSDSTQYMRRLKSLADRPADQPAPCEWVAESEQAQAPAQDLQKYMDAYDFAPVGFVTLDKQGRVIQSNLAAAIMLDTQRSQCQLKDFTDFLDEKSRAPFMRFHQEVLSGQCRRFFVVHLPATAHREAMILRIDATADEDGEENRMVMIDGQQLPGLSSV